MFVNKNKNSNEFNNLKNDASLNTAQTNNDINFDKNNNDSNNNKNPGKNKNKIEEEDLERLRQSITDMVNDISAFNMFDITKSTGWGKRIINTYNYS